MGAPIALERTGPTGPVASSRDFTDQIMAAIAALSGQQMVPTPTPTATEDACRRPGSEARARRWHRRNRHNVCGLRKQQVHTAGLGSPRALFHPPGVGAGSARAPWVR